MRADLSSIASIRLGSGPIGLIFSSFVSFFFDIPVSTRFKLLGFEVSEKSFVYFVGLQVCNCSLFLSIGFRIKSWICYPFESKACLEEDRPNRIDCNVLRTVGRSEVSLFELVGVSASGDLWVVFHDTGCIMAWSDICPLCLRSFYCGQGGNLWFQGFAEWLPASFTDTM